MIGLCRLGRSRKGEAWPGSGYARGARPQLGALGHMLMHRSIRVFVARRRLARVSRVSARPTAPRTRRYKNGLNIRTYRTHSVRIMFIYDRVEFYIRRGLAASTDTLSPDDTRSDSPGKQRVEPSRPAWRPRPVPNGPQITFAIYSRLTSRPRCFMSQRSRCRQSTCRHRGRRGPAAGGASIADARTSSICALAGAP